MTFWILNTDESEDPGHGAYVRMLHHSRVATWGTLRGKMLIAEPAAGDVVFLYRDKVGVIAMAEFDETPPFSTNEIFGMQAHGEMSRSVLNLTEAPTGPIRSTHVKAATGYTLPVKGRTPKRILDADAGDYLQAVFNGDIDLHAPLIGNQEPNLMDLVREAGIDVSDWANCKRGLEGAPWNPQYCYDWAFTGPGSVIVLCIWTDLFSVIEGITTATVNPRAVADANRGLPKKRLVVLRAEAMDAAIQEALLNSIPVRVIACNRAGADLRGTQHVVKRRLDPVSWSVATYDRDTGEATLKQGIAPARFVDQFSTVEPEDSTPRRRSRTGEEIVRDPDVRKRALLRAHGRCEWCGVPGFLTTNGDCYLETHHIVPLSEGGADHERNVVALCPNHHREAHFGMTRESLRDDFLGRRKSAGP